MTQEESAPYSHDLNELASLLHNNWTEEERDAFDQLSEFAILVRYGDERWFLNNATDKKASEWYARTDEFVSRILL